MKIKRILLGLVIGWAVLLGGIWVLSKTLGNDRPVSFHGETLDQWIAEAGARDAAVSNQANVVLNNEIIPQLENQMFHDTNDSNIRLTVVNALNGLPGVDYIMYNLASVRRAEAAGNLGGFGPAAKAAIPALMQAVQGSDEAVHEKALASLGKIHGEPDKVIPFLIKYLDDDNLNDEAATALSEFGSLARPAVPKIIPLLHAADDDARAAAAEALKKIDPAAYTNATSQASGN